MIPRPSPVRVALVALVLVLPWWWAQPRLHASEWADEPTAALGPSAASWAVSAGRAGILAPDGLLP